MDTFGTFFRVTLFGESHGPVVGVVIDGVPSGLSLDVGDFAENITTRGIELFTLPLGTKIYIGDTILEVSKIGKECHKGCDIKNLVGDCIMPKRGIFARVIKGGEVNLEDTCYYWKSQKKRKFKYFIADNFIKAAQWTD